MDLHTILPLGDTQVDPVSGTARTSAYQQGNADQWKRAQQSQRRRGLLQRLLQALEQADFAEAHHLLEAIAADELFSAAALTDDFEALQSAVAAHDLPAAQQALARLRPHDVEAPTAHPVKPVDSELREVLSAKDDDDATGNHLDVTA